MKFDNILAEIAYTHKSERQSLFGGFYFELLKNKKDHITKVVEIGIGNGSGLMTWRDFFPNAKIFGVDNRGRLLMRRNRLESIHADQSVQSDLVKIIEKTGTDIDLFIDDGSHNPHDQILTFMTIMPLLKKEVTYVIEGVQDENIVNELAEYDFEAIDFESADTGYFNRILVIKNKKKSEKVSIIISARGETKEATPGVTYLQRTVQDIYENATGNFEVIVGFNGPPYQDFPDYPNFRTIKLPESIGLKMMINVLAATATGKYLYKTDAHCKFGYGFDEILTADMQDNWLVTPRFYVLNPATWEWQDDRHYDYFYLCCPFTDPRGFRFKAGGHWPQLTAEREKNHQFDIDETPQFHGSGWLVERDFFLNKIGGFPNQDPTGHAQEPPNIGLKYWLGPWEGKVMINKKTWYAHVHQDNSVKDFKYTREEERHAYDFWARYWMADKWEERVHNIDWFIERFMPMPTWPENWREILETWQKENKNK